MWLVFIAIYVGFVAIVAFLAHSRAPSTDVFAKRPLPTHHLVLADDLKTSRDDLDEDLLASIVAPYVGKYVVKQVAEKKLLTVRELSALPVLEKQKGAQRILFPVKAEYVASGNINAQLPAHLCIVTGAPTKVNIVTVLCAPNVRDPCSAIVDLTADIAPKSGQGPGEIFPPSTPSCS